MVKKQLEITAEDARNILNATQENAAAMLKIWIRGLFTEEELQPEVKSWEDLKRIDGYYVSYDSSVSHMLDTLACSGNKNIFATENQAKSALAMAQLSQLMKQVNGDWKPDWENAAQEKWSIVPHDTSLVKLKRGYEGGFLVFPSVGVGRKFLGNHVGLIREYFMMHE